MFNVSQAMRLITATTDAYDLAGYEPGSNVTTAAEAVTTAVGLSAEAAVARDAAKTAMDSALRTGDLDAYAAARLRHETLSTMITDGTFNAGLSSATIAQGVAVLNDYREFGRAEVTAKFNSEAEGFMAAYSSFSGDLKDVFRDQAQGAFLAAMQEHGKNLTVLRTVNDAMARYGVVASILDPVSGVRNSPDVLSAETITRYLGGAAYPQPDNNVRRRPADANYGPAAPWVKALQQEAIARPNTPLTLRMLDLDAQGTEMLALTERWTAAKAAAGQSNYYAPTAYGWKIPKADVDTAVAEARSRYEQAHSISA